MISFVHFLCSKPPIVFEQSGLIVPIGQKILAIAISWLSSAPAARRDGGVGHFRWRGRTATMRRSTRDDPETTPPNSVRQQIHSLVEGSATPGPHYAIRLSAA